MESRTIRDLKNFSDLDAEVGFPAVAKILSPDIAHKAKAGGVVTPIPDLAALRAAARRILAAVADAMPAARRSGILVQPVESGLAEAFLGFRIDPRIGPVVALGLGGALAEVTRDLAVRRAPVSLADAEVMIEEVRGLAPLGQDRGAGAGDVSALAQAICAFSDLARLPACGLGIAEINPLIVKAPGRGVVAVDGLVVRAGPAG